VKSRGAERRGDGVLSARDGNIAATDAWYQTSVPDRLGVLGELLAE
jgi:hypothetical protein